MIKYVLVSVIAYLLGNFSTSYLISRAAGKIDIRKYGSGNAGSTNVLRVLGVKAAAVAFLGDLLKGTAAVLIGKQLGGSYGEIVAGISVVLGHNWPVFLKFKGGKGIATTIGLMIPIDPIMVLLIVASSTVLGHFIAVTNIPEDAAAWIVGLPLNRHIIMSIIFIVYLVGGSFIDDLAFMILATPIFFPAIIKLGYDPIWACIMVSLTVCVGSVIPPVAMCVFVVRNITKVPMGIIYSGVYPFLISLFVCIILLFIFPELVLYLPSVFME